MDLNMLKTQMMTMFMMKGGTNNGNNGHSDIWMILYSMMAISIIEWLFRQLPLAITATSEYAKPLITQWVSQRHKTITNTLSLDSSSHTYKPLSTVTLTRSYSDDGKSKTSSPDNPIIEKVDAVLDYICSLDAAQHIRMDTRISLNTSGSIQVTKELSARINQMSNTANNDSHVEITLSSTDLSVSQIRAWIDQIHADFVAEKNNRLGNRIYYFEEIPTTPPTTVDMSSGTPVTRYKWDSAPRALTFTMHEFRTNKSFNNIYGHHVDELRDRLNLFQHHPEWYAERGIPHTLGILLSGVPGAGKTSTFKALIKDTGRHPIVVKIRSHTTQHQLKNLFFNETLVVQTPEGQKQTLKIPFNKRLYLLEEVDCHSDILLDRWQFPERKQPEGDAVTLDFLLNLTDGVLERPDNIIGMSANRPEILDRAFIRPGRVDVRIHFGLVDEQYLRDMFQRFYEDVLSTEEPILPESLASLDNLFTPAEVMECMCNHYREPRQALSQLMAKAEERRPVTLTEVQPQPQPQTTETQPQQPQQPQQQPPVTPMETQPQPQPQQTTESVLEATRPPAQKLSIEPMSSTELPFAMFTFDKFGKCPVCDLWIDITNSEIVAQHNVAHTANKQGKFYQTGIPEAQVVERRYLGVAYTCPNPKHMGIPWTNPKGVDETCPGCLDAKRSTDSIRWRLFPESGQVQQMSDDVITHVPASRIQQGAGNNGVGGSRVDEIMARMAAEKEITIAGNQFLLKQQQERMDSITYSGFGGFGRHDDMFSSALFGDAQPPPGAPPFDMSIFSASIRSNINQTPISNVVSISGHLRVPVHFP